MTIATLRERLWSGPPPASAASAIHVHVHHLRRVLDAPAPGDGDPEEGGPGDRPRLTTCPGRPSDQVGYALHVPPGQVDTALFRGLLDAGREARARGDVPSALDRFEAALALWRGDPVPEFPPSAFALGVRRDLADLRAEAAVDRAACLLDLGLASRAEAELRELHAGRPDDERVVVMLSTALCRLGADGRALRLLTGELDRWEREYGVRPPTLLRERERVMGGSAGPAHGRGPV